MQNMLDILYDLKIIFELYIVPVQDIGFSMEYTNASGDKTVSLHYDSLLLTFHFLNRFCSVKAFSTLLFCKANFIFACFLPFLLFFICDLPSSFLVFMLRHFWLFYSWSYLTGVMSLTKWVNALAANHWYIMPSSMIGLKILHTSWISLQGNFCTCMAGNYKLIWDNSYSTFFKKVRFTMLSVA